MQFGRPLARFQIVQEKLVQMLCDVTASAAVIACASDGRRCGGMSDTIAALAKLNNTVKARGVLPRPAILSVATASCWRTT